MEIIKGAREVAKMLSPLFKNPMRTITIGGLAVILLTDPRVQSIQALFAQEDSVNATPTSTKVPFSHTPTTTKVPLTRGVATAATETPFLPPNSTCPEPFKASPTFTKVPFRHTPTATEIS